MGTLMKKYKSCVAMSSWKESQGFAEENIALLTLRYSFFVPYSIKRLTSQTDNTVEKLGFLPKAVL